MSDGSLWIFGYGSLVWRPAFSHRRACPAAIRGHVRRFWQGSTDHRGRPGRPGRVVTLIPDGRADGPGRDDAGSTEPCAAPAAAPDPRCWGTAYEIPAGDPDGVIEALDHRERGGYDRVEIDIELHVDLDAPSASNPSATSDDVVPGLVYIAGPGNPHYLGGAPVHEIARQVASAAGPSGANPDYVFELARSLRGMGAADSHVFEVESQLRRLLG